MNRKLCEYPLMHEEEIRIYGLRRSGNHAITNWLISHLLDSGKQVAYLNDLNHSYPPSYEALLEGSPLPSLKNRVPTPVVANSGVLVLSFEEGGSKKWAENMVGTGCKNIKKVWIKRDPKEVWASRLGRKINLMRKTETGGRKAQKWEENLWCRGQRGVFRMLKIWENMFPPHKDTIIIEYEKWNDEKKYRDEVLSKFGLENLDKGKDEVPGHGFGSSFDRPPKAGERRYPMLKNHPMMVDFVKQLHNVEKRIEKTVGTYD